ncbi:DUF983 domain-containing protein [Hymenobacter profundi]|nr:DUF983 domain-containing protein [Hymenobacter profundi]
MAAHDSPVSALLAQKCPRCHRGHLFTHGMYNLAHYTEMPVACPVCGLAFEPEPGFYIGAMYISYVFTTGIVLLVGLLVYHLLGDPDTWVYVASVTVAVVGLLPVLLRYSRTVMLYFFGNAGYDPHATRRAWHGGGDE